jgi:hypothetical protein
MKMLQGALADAKRVEFIKRVKQLAFRDQFCLSRADGARLRNFPSNRNIEFRARLLRD